MHELDDQTLLRQYAEQNSDSAFAVLVARHVDKVYSVALRHTRNAHAAEEITQAVFVILTRKANSLGKHTALSGWLYETARLTSATYIRSEIRRARREQEAHMQTALNENADDAWPHIAPLLDDALAGMSAADRHAIVLRYFDGKSLGEVGAALGASEDAAKKRVTRAVEKLRGFFTKRGVTLTATVLTAAISANSVQAAPLGLAATVTATAKGAVVSGSTLTLIKGALKVMAWTKMKTAIAFGAVTVLVVGTTAIAVEDLFKHLDTDPNGSNQLESVSPTFLIRPTQYPTNRVGFQNPSGKSIVANTPFTEMIRHAYGFTTTVRMILPTDLPQGQFDYLNSLPEHQQEALRAELQKQFGLIAHVETKVVDVLLLKVKDPVKLATHLKQEGKSNNLGTFKMSRGKANDAITGFESMQLAELLETIFKKPVIDQTGSTSFYEWKNKAEMTFGKGKSEEEGWRIGIDQLGLELVPSREPVEMLVVEKVK
jgi:uncharacterized protein (TIGR03435 family)